MFKNVDLANTLKIVAEKGIDAFYNGEIAEKIVAEFQAAGGIMDKESLANHKVEVYEPIETEYEFSNVSAEDLNNLLDSVDQLLEGSLDQLNEEPGTLEFNNQIFDESASSNTDEHVIATNEGSAISIGIGHYLSTKKIPCIYMQNSGLSNALNPLISIAHQKVYSIPLILIIGWRGYLKGDAPEHEKIGKIQPKLLSNIGLIN